MSTLEIGGKKLEKLWFRFSEDLLPTLPTKGNAEQTHLIQADAFLIADIFRIMQGGESCHVHGNVSPSLIRNLVEFQSAWTCWRPDLYKQVEITADSGQEFRVSRQGDNEKTHLSQREVPCIAAFTGGVDSSYTIYRHLVDDTNSPARRNIEAALFVHGFDISLDETEAFTRASQRAEQVLNSVKCKLITMSSNHKSLNPIWNETHIAGVASCLTLMSGYYEEGLIASGCSYNGLLIPWGSNPITDHLLSSSNFRITHDGASLKRSQKMQAMENWKEGFESLWVCYSAVRADENCGKCPKCVMTILALRIMKIATPSSFPELNDEAIEKLEGVTDYQMETWRGLRRAAIDGGIKESWVEALCKRVDELEAVLPKASTGSKVRLITPRMSKVGSWFSRKRLSGLLRRTFSGNSPRDKN
jgi:hypothetical protein